MTSNRDDSTGTDPVAAAPPGQAGAPGPAAGPSRRRTEVHSLTQLSTDEILAELDRRERRIRHLEDRASRLRELLAELDRQLAEVGEQLPALESAVAVSARGRNGRQQDDAAPAPRRSAGRRTPRAKNDVSLADALAAAIEVRARVSVAEAADLVLKNGYTSNSKKFAMTVATTLGKDSRFRRVERGLYERV
jgi:TolA-binding protein